ncbi:MAG: hypothetical protein PHZ04_00280 [Patescibacteria group bacterium]|nr:hypothetical protein [Patescibacteria group bacterium]MDD5294616.1 hypothetical protein [Patescibacteria group bacterium]MDD5555019.1 hypothetical protein [Patescibacteria group bacterium]
MIKRFLNLIIALVSLAALAGLVYIVFFYDFTGKNIISREKNVSAPSAETGSEEETVVLSSENQKDLLAGKREISESEIAQENLKRMAASFAERFGSYSNHSSYSNISDLKIFMTSAMQAWADKFVEETKAKQGPNDAYYGVTTKAVAVEVKMFNEGAGQAEILVNTQKRESSGTMDNVSLTYQNILISFVKEADSWKVDGAEWQNE